MKFHQLVGAIALVSVSTAVLADATSYPAGYLCCNMRTDGSWISDINYQDAGKKGLPVGTLLKVTGYGRNRVNVDINGQKQSIGNDYSRSTPLDVFARRYVVEQDPLTKIVSFPKKIQDAIASARVTKGMTREQVLMAIGYPVSDENPSLDSKEWRFWLSSFVEFVVVFDDKGLLQKVDTDFDTRSKVYLE
jgi:hypothetical protein